MCVLLRKSLKQLTCLLLPEVTNRILTQPGIYGIATSLGLVSKNITDSFTRILFLNLARLQAYIRHLLLASPCSMQVSLWSKVDSLDDLTWGSAAVTIVLGTTPVTDSSVPEITLFCRKRRRAAPWIQTLDTYYFAHHSPLRNSLGGVLRGYSHDEILSSTSPNCPIRQQNGHNRV